jgi:hypothetical protein
LGNSPNDGQAKSVSLIMAETLAAALLQGPKEPLEFSGWHHRSGVADREAHSTRSRSGRNFGHSADGIVPQGVVDEVGYQTLDQPGVTDDWSCYESGFDADPASVRFLVARSEYLFGDLAQVEGFPALDASLAGCQSQERVYKPLLLLAELERLLAGRP